MVTQETQVSSISTLTKLMHPSHHQKQVQNRKLKTSETEQVPKANESELLVEIEDFVN